MNSPFDRANVAVRERPDSGTLNRAQAQADRSLRDLVQAMFAARSLTSAAGVPYSGFVGDGFRVVPTSPTGLSVQVTAGFGFFQDITDLPANIGDPDLQGVADLSTYKPLFLVAPAVFPVPAAPPAGQSRIDIIEVKPERRLTDPATRRVLDAETLGFLDKTISKTLTWALDGRVGSVTSPNPSTAAISYKIGVPALTGFELQPATTPGYLKIGTVFVGPTIDGNDIADHRPLLFPGGHAQFGGIFRIQWNGGSPIHTAVAINAPPGIQMGIAPLTGVPARGSCEFYVLGGEIRSGSITMTAAPTTVLPNQLAFGIQTPILASGNPIQTVSSVSGVLPFQLSVSTPVLTGGDGTRVLSGRIQSRHVDGAGVVSNTNVFLEDVVVHVTGTVSYL